MGNEVILSLGSRSGATVALGFYCLVFLSLGIAVTVSLRRAAASRLVAFVVGMLCCAGPVGLICATSLNGFYDARVLGDSVRLDYLLPFGRQQFAVTDITQVEARPAYNMHWRLHIQTASGQRYVSAIGRRADAEDAMRALQALVQGDDD